MPVEIWGAGKDDPQTCFALHISFVAGYPVTVISELRDNPGPYVEKHLPEICGKLEEFFNKPIGEIEVYLQDCPTGRLQRLDIQRVQTLSGEGVVAVLSRQDVSKEAVEATMKESIKVPELYPSSQIDPDREPEID